LLSAGNSHRRTTFILYTWTAAFAIPTVIAAFAPLWIAIVVAMGMFAFSLAMMGDTARRVAAENREVTHV
jgi:UDP-GlcNAc:undecaprenyl-phosphate GlcNAc-1-phosphate transferase